MACCRSDSAAQRQELEDLDAEERALHERLDAVQQKVLESRKSARELKQQLAAYESLMEQLRQYANFDADKRLLYAAQSAQIDELHDLLRQLEVGEPAVEKDAVLQRLQIACGGFAPFENACGQSAEAGSA